VEFLSIFRMSSPPHKRKAPSIENFLATDLWSRKDKFGMVSEISNRQKNV